MANHPSALKRSRQNTKRKARNRILRSIIKTQIKNLQTLIAENNSENAPEELKKTIKTIAQSSSKGILHWKTAARKVSRLTRKVNALQSKSSE